MKKRKISGLMIGLFVLTFVLTACSAKSEDNSVAYDTDTSDNGSYDMVAEGETKYTTSLDSQEQSEAPAADSSTGSSDGLQSSSSVSSGNVAAQEQDKIIRTFFMDVETQKFDSLITRINSDIKRLNGYVESSNISGKGYSSNGGTRYGSIEARIPSDKVDEFVGTVKENANANVVNQKETSENVSLKYIDAQSRVETLKIEQERLFAILDKETSLDNIIVLESRLSDIRYELQNYESQLRYYDNMVAYSTVTLSIQEVEIFTPVTEEKQSLGTRMKNGLSDTMYHLSEGFQNFLVWLVVNLPYLIIWGIIIAVAAIITRRIMKKSKTNTTNQPTPPMYNVMQNMGQSNQNDNDKNNPNQR